MAENKRNEVLIRLRGERDRAVVAKAIGISERALQSYELGDRVPRDSVKQKIAKYYGRTVQHIFF